jgi:hypothetical protein
MNNQPTPAFVKLVSDSIENYETYYKRKRQPSELFVIKQAIIRICETYYGDKIPNIYVMYLSADAAFRLLNKTKHEFELINELETELIKDIHIFNQLV